MFNPSDIIARLLFWESSPNFDDRPPTCSALHYTSLYFKALHFNDIFFTVLQFIESIIVHSALLKLRLNTDPETRGDSP